VTVILFKVSSVTMYPRVFWYMPTPMKMTCVLDPSGVPVRVEVVVRLTLLIPCR